MFLIADDIEEDIQSWIHTKRLHNFAILRGLKFLISSKKRKKKEMRNFLVRSSFLLKLKLRGEKSISIVSQF